ncbi:MAG: GntR family transcriptional regulator [Lentisphaerae bacterium]|nr:GntR family transcriptional regulator [Lentisphaerota bacterium]
MLSKKSIVIETLLQEIREGKITPGEFIPSRNQLMHRFHCSRTVVENAIAVLTGQGLLAGKQGKGTFVRQTAKNNFEPLRKINVISRYDAKSFSSAINCVQFDINDFGLPVEVISPARANAESEILTGNDVLNVHINPDFQQLPLLNYLKERDVRQILINREFDGFDRIYTDTLTGFRQGLEFFRNLPGREICLLARAPEIQYPYQTSRLLSFYQACAERSLPITEKNTMIHPFRKIEKEIVSVKKFFQTLPVKIAVLNPELILPLLNLAAGSGLQPGKDFSLLLFDCFLELPEILNTVVIRQKYDFFYGELKRYVNTLDENCNGGNFTAAIPPEVTVTGT